MTLSPAYAEVKRAWRIISTRVYTFAVRYDLREVTTLRFYTEVSALFEQRKSQISL